MIYESLHELSCLLLADFDGAVERIVAQPFQLTFPTRPKPTTHVPDFLLSTDQYLFRPYVVYRSRDVAAKDHLMGSTPQRRGW